MNKKYLISDADGVLLDWNTPFDNFIHHNNGWQLLKPLSANKDYCLIERFKPTAASVDAAVRAFNESKEFSQLKPLYSSEYFLPKIKDLGYSIVVISACGFNDIIYDNRVKNLTDCYGDIFEEIILVNEPEQKRDVLKRYPSSYWIEDSYTNAVIGHETKHTPILFNHETNNLNFIMVKDWKEIYLRLINDQ